MCAILLAFAIASSLNAYAPQVADPKALSLHPFTGQRGTSLHAVLRGTGLKDARAVDVGSAPFTVEVESREQESPVEASGQEKLPIDLVKLRIQVSPDARPGKYPIRLISRNGISNTLTFRIVDSEVAIEPEGEHETQESAVKISKLPIVYAGRLARRGETDYYSFHVEAGETLTFEAISGLPQIAAGGSAATVAKFDPALTVYERAGSWFDPKHINRIAYNDEPAWVFGGTTDARLSQRFEKSGDYLVRVEAFAGQGGPDYSYELKIARGDSIAEGKPGGGDQWDERGWTRRLDTKRLEQLGQRGGKDGTHQPEVETYRTGLEPISFRLPGNLEGALIERGVTHRARFRLDKPSDIAVEIETPDAAPPFFNPVFRLLNSAGTEVASSVFAGKGACSGAMTKALEAKTLVPLRDTGDYTLEIRDATADLAGPDFRYRLQVRPQVPHVGRVEVQVDHLNLEQSRAKTVHVTFDREEDFRGAVMVAAESLPPGVSAVAGADFDPPKDATPVVGKPERYTPRTEKIVLVFTAAADAPISASPQSVRIVVRPLVDSQPGIILDTKTFPLMVVPKT